MPKIEFTLLTASWVLAFVISLTGCSNRAEQLEKKLSVAQESGASRDDKCRITAEIADAWLAQGNAQEAKHWTTVRDATCSMAELCRSIVGGC
jgi:uncharacterized lipoprotein NlpE involved in copper resistance